MKQNSRHQFHRKGQDRQVNQLKFKLINHDLLELVKSTAMSS